MNLMKYLYSKDSIKRKILDIEDDIEELIKNKCSEKFNLVWYGAYDIDLKHLVYWVCIESDKLKDQLTDDILLNEQLRMLLKKHNYPKKARPFVSIGFESQETVDRESDGNWYHHFK